MSNLPNVPDPRGKEISLEEPNPKKTKPKGRFFLFFLLILVLAAIGYQVYKMAQARGQAAPVEEAAAEPVFSVNTTFARLGEIQDHLSINGDIIANETVDVYPDTVGKLSRLLVSMGTPVRRDQILAWVDPSRPGMNYSESPVRSPITGTVTAIYGHVGGMASNQAPLLVVGDLSSLKVRTYIPERFTALIRMNQRAALTFATLPGVTFQARVSEISPVVNPVSRTMEIRLSLVLPPADVSRSGIKAGMYANIDLIMQTKPQAVLVPSSCLVNRFDENYLFVIDEGRARLQRVAPGIVQEGVTEIIEGVSAGEEIIYEGIVQVNDGSLVNIISQKEVL
ncbi:MAG: efflux RND transporter periplasmic adaptor subunit [Spirochaetales bacterium]|jgi:multidrug efflux pump subunit AcrA (membrane-fusion protein)|nr:efflux RND transporter periplasmic adaptor subunit [Spirochaetales bacterium]